MTSNNRLFQNYLYRQSTLVGNSMNDIEFITKSQSEWKAMTDEEKLIYGNTDGNPRVRPKSSAVRNGDQYWTDSAQLPPIEELEKLDLRQLNEEIETKIIDVLALLKDRNELMDTKFYFMSTNIQCKVNSGYRPIEIGIIEYTIRDGIQRNYHQFIDCGPVPFGYYFPAMDHMKRVHKIPIKDFVLSSKDYQRIGKSILDLLSDSCPNDRLKQVFENPLIVFSKWDQLRQNGGALKWIENMAKQVYQQSGQVFKLNARVLNASKLLSALLSINEDVRPIGWCETALSTSAFDYTSGTDCTFHEDIGCIDCALGVAKRIAYSMSNILRQSFDINLKATHIPVVKGFKNLQIRDFCQMGPELDFDYEEFKQKCKVDEEMEESDNCFEKY